MSRCGGKEGCVCVCVCVCVGVVDRARMCVHEWMCDGGTCRRDVMR